MSLTTDDICDSEINLIFTNSEAAALFHVFSSINIGEWVKDNVPMNHQQEWISLLEKDYLILKLACLKFDEAIRARGKNES